MFLLNISAKALDFFSHHFYSLFFPVGFQEYFIMIEEYMREHSINIIRKMNEIVSHL